MSTATFAPAAVRDLSGIVDYVSRDDADAASRIVDQIEERVRRLAESPESGSLREGLSPGLRCWSVGRYVIYYRTTVDGIEVVRVLHGARDVDRLF